VLLQRGGSSGTAQQALPWWEVTEEKPNRKVPGAPAGLWAASAKGTSWDAC